VFEITLDNSTLVLVGLLFGLVMVAPMIMSVVQEACKPTDPTDIGEDK